MCVCWKFLVANWLLAGKESSGSSCIWKWLLFNSVFETFSWQMCGVKWQDQSRYGIRVRGMHVHQVTTRTSVILSPTAFVMLTTAFRQATTVYRGLTRRARAAKVAALAPSSPVQAVTKVRILAISTTGVHRSRNLPTFTGVVTVVTICSPVYDVFLLCWHWECWGFGKMEDCRW